MQSGFFKPVASSLVGVMTLTGVLGVNPHPSMAQLPALESVPQNPTNSNAVVQPNTAYALGGGDRVTIDVFEVPQYSGEYQIPIDGVLFLPLIGGVTVGGLTVEQASNAIATRYSRYLKRPIITVRLLSPRPLNVFVSGEVSRPGSYSLPLVGGAGDRPGAQYPTLTQAIQQAGGVTLAADLTQVQLRRRVVGSNTAQLVTYNVRELLRTGEQPQEQTLRDGDSIFIPTATNVSLNETRQIATLGFAANPSNPRQVSVVGEVNRPGTYILTGVANENGVVTGITGGLPTVAQALKQAGGIRPLADIRRIQLRRLTKLGTEQIIDVNLYALLQTGDVNQDAVLQEGDTIVVPKAADIPPAEATELATASFSPDSIQITVVGEVVTPGLVRIPPNTPLNQGLLAAGGFNTRRARRSDIELVRLNPDGSVSKRTVPINFAQGINEESNPTLRNNDIIIVRRSNTASITDSISTFLSPVAGVADLLGFPGQVSNILDLLGIISPNND